MPRTWRAMYVAPLLFAAVSCGSSPTASSTTSTLHGEVSDTIGDTITDARVSIPPDLARATVDVAAGNVSIVVALAPGTLNRQTTRVSALLDIDQNGATGIRQGDGIGADYSIDLAASTGQATITQADSVGCAAHLSCFNAVGSVAITFAGDSMQVVVPLSMIGNADGHMTFQLNAYVVVAPSTTVIFDFMPDGSVAPGRVQ